MIKVQLDKGEKGLCIWEHADRKSAMRRAKALVEVHGPFYTDLHDEGDTIIVDASHFYCPKQK
jgi:hypothetical protein